MIMRQIGVFFLLLGLVTAGACKPRSQTSSVREDGTDQTEMDEAVGKINELLSLYKSNVSEERRREVRQQAWTLLQDLDNRGLLDNLIKVLISRAPQLAEAPEAQREAMATMAYNSVKAELQNRTKFESWDEVDQKLMSAVSGTNNLALPQALETLGHFNENEGTTVSKLLPFTDGRVLINGTDSWPLRKQLIAGAKKNIWIFCWAFYSDGTGNDGVEALIAKKRQNPGVDIRVLVDGPTESKPGYTEAVQKLIDANVGIELIRWNHPRLVGYGMHRKIMIVDHEGANGSKPAAIFGGMNYGDNYSHENQTLAPLDLWRDTDMVVYGAPVKQAAWYFARAWNSYVSNRGTLVSSARLTEIPMPQAPRPTGRSSSSFAFVDQDPSQVEANPNYLDPIYLVTLRMIESAKSTIDISNAYYITTPPIERALARAANCGVQVRVHTNASSSLTAEDKPLLGPIYKSLHKTLAIQPGDNSASTAGKTGGRQCATQSFKAPRVFLQKDHTLHSKYMIVDGKYGWLGSYNVHPRSYRYEGETVGMFHGSGTPGSIESEVQKMFDRDISAANADPATADAVVLPENTFFDMLEAFFFEQL